MESPSYAPAPKKSKVGIILLVIGVCLLTCCIVPGIFIFSCGKQLVNHAKGFVVCGAEMSAQRDALMAYAKKNGNKLPAAAKWQDDIRPFMKALTVDESLGKLPPNDGDECDMQSGTGVCYNTDVAGKDVTKLTGEQIVLWEVTGTGLNRSKKYVEPEFVTSPKIIGGIPRGWIVQPLEGPSDLIQQNGRVSPLVGSDQLKSKH